MSLLVAALFLSRPASNCIREQCTALFHTSALSAGAAIKMKRTRHGSKGGPKIQMKMASRTRLAKDLRPRMQSAVSGKLRTAPRTSREPRIQFERKSPLASSSRGPHENDRARTKRRPSTTSNPADRSNSYQPQAKSRSSKTLEHSMKENTQSRRNALITNSKKPGTADRSSFGNKSATSNTTEFHADEAMKHKRTPSVGSDFSRDSVPHTGMPEVSRRSDRIAHRRRPEDVRRRSAGSKSGTDRQPWSSNESTDRAAVQVLLDQEFDRSDKSESASGLPSRFTSPPLMEGLLVSVKSVLGEDAKPTPIQALSLKHLFPRLSRASHEGSLSATNTATDWKQYLLASETGSGKSIAYLLPMLQHLKQTEGQQDRPASSLPINPRALVLAPTHELARQLSTFAKSLLHNVKLRVLCSSRANVPSSPRGVGGGTASKMAGKISALASSTPDSSGAMEIEVRPQMGARPVDVLVGTPMKALEMVRGWGWDKVEERNSVENMWELDERGKRLKRRKFYPGSPEMGLAEIEFVVIDEADVLFDPDFQESTRTLLADISAARGHPIPLTSGSSSTSPSPLNYPFHLILTSATIPSSLASYLDTYHPHLTRLASPNLHRLPPTLRTEHVSWTGGNRNADIEKRIRRVWAEDALRGPDVHGRRQKSKVLVFCNRSTKVEDLSAYLTTQGVENVALTSSSDSRRPGSNHHLDGFLKLAESKNLVPVASVGEKKRDEPHVLVTTSLLSRGLDFAPSIKHVFIVDSPRNMIDFLHRAGRSGRAGQAGKVVVFGKMKGRGSSVAKDVRRKVGALVY